MTYYNPIDWSKEEPAVATKRSEVRPPWVSTKDRLPPSESIDAPCNRYYVVLVEGYGEHIAMFCDGEWYANYISKIFREVTHWLPPAEPREWTRE